MPKYWGKQIFTNGSPRSGSKAKEGEKKKERLNDGNNNGHLFIATPPRWHTQSRLGQQNIHAGAQKLNLIY